ncbi:MAG TPA: hypothetical protein DCL61_21025 [Cyanobacteria bacterium UBA12227]|nr:hypothetical protein [Cyanobacteria bacterium UBA12227]
MIGNINKGNYPYSTIRYVGFKDGAKVLDTNMAGQTPAQLANEFEYFSKKSKLTQKPVFHLSINPHPNDRPLSTEEYIDIASDIRMELGFDDYKHQYLLALHTDALHKDNPEIRPHVHLIVNRVNFEGKCKKDYLDYINIQKACRKVELKYGLITQPHSWEISEKKGPPSREEETKFIQDAIKEAAANKPEMPDFINRLLSKNVGVQCRITRTGKLQGISYEYNNKLFKGRQLGSDYTHQGIQSKFGVVHKPTHKERIELLIANYQAGNIQNISSTSTSSDSESNSNSELTVNNLEITPTVQPALNLEQPLTPYPTTRKDNFTQNVNNKEFKSQTYEPHSYTDESPSAVEEPLPTPNSPDQTLDNQQQQQYAEVIANTVRMFWEKQKPDRVLRGSIFDLELENSTIKIKRKSGEEIAQIPLSEDQQPIGIALNLEDLKIFHQLQQLLDSNRAKQQQKRSRDSGLEL